MGADPPPDGGLEHWVSPSRTSRVDQVDLDEIRDGWVPARVGEPDLEGTAVLLRAVGVIEPVLLRPVEEGYEVVTGHRTVAAARLAGLAGVAAVVRQLDDAQALIALALDGSAAGRLTAAAAAELRGRLVAAGVAEDEVAELMTAVPVAAEAVVADPAEARPADVPAAPPSGAPPGAAPSAAASHAGAQPAAARWVPLPAGRPRLARLSSAFADTPRMLRLLAADGFTGTVELAGPDGRRDSVAFLEGQCVATSTELGGARVRRSLRLPMPDRGPVVEITVRPHPAPVVIALALALRSAPRLWGLDASFLVLPGLLEALARRGGDAAVVVSTPRGTGIVLVAEGRPVAAYARRRGEAPSEADETTAVEAVADLLGGGEGEVDVHDGPLVDPLDLEEVIAASTPGTG